MNIYNQDFRVSGLKADFVVTDPPYNIGFKYGSYSDNYDAGEYIALLAKMRDISTRLVVIQYPEETMRYLVPALGVPEISLAWCYNSNIPRRFRLVNFYGFRPNLSKVKQVYKNPNDKRVKALIDAGSEGTPTLNISLLRRLD